MSRRPDLIVPIRDRRQRKRYLTLKNFGIVALVMLVAFIAISIRSEMRGLQRGDYGRLFRSEIPAPVEPKPMEVVREELPAVDDQTHADPMLVEPMARAQWLADGSAATATTATAPPVTGASVRGEAGVAIVGGVEGVTVVRREKRRPVLSGGFGRE